MSSASDLAEVIRDVKAWVDKADSHSWLAHALIALPIAKVGQLIYAVLIYFGVSPEAAVAVDTTLMTFGVREAEQWLLRIAAAISLRLRDPVMDVVAPVVLVALAWWLL